MAAGDRPKRGRGRPGKSLLQLVEEGGFRKARHRELLSGEPLPWKSLSRLQEAYRAAEFEIEKHRIAVLFEREIPRLHARQERSRKGLDEVLAGLGPPRSADRVVNFFPRFFRHYAGSRAGRPFRLESFQERYIREFWRQRKDGGRVYTFGLLGIPKGNGKTPIAAGLGVNALMDSPTGDKPEVVALTHERRRDRVDGDEAADRDPARLDRLERGPGGVVDDQELARRGLPGADELLGLEEFLVELAVAAKRDRCLAGPVEDPELLAALADRGGETDGDRELAELECPIPDRPAHVANGRGAG